MNHRNAISDCVSELHVMKRTNKLPLLKAIPILGVLSMGVLVLVSVICINESKSFLPAFATYIDSGRSLFIPDLPRIDILWFLPLELQFIPLTLGNVIDIVIFINIGLVLNRIPYECYRRASESQLMIPIVDLHLDGRYMKSKVGNTIDGKCSMPCIDARALLGSPATREAKSTDLPLQHEDLGLEPLISNAQSTSRWIPLRARMTSLACLGFHVFNVIPSSFLFEGFFRSGSCSSSSLSLPAIFQEVGAYP